MPRLLLITTFLLCVLFSSAALQTRENLAPTLTATTRDESSAPASPRISHLLNFLTTKASKSNVKAFDVVSAVKDEDFDTDISDVFIPSTAHSVEQTIAPIIQDPNFCTFPELFRGNTGQRAPRNARFFHRTEDDPIIKFKLWYRVKDGIAIVRITALGGSYIRRVGAIIRLGDFQLTRGKQIRPKTRYDRNDPDRFLFQRSFDYNSISDIPRVSAFEPCCGERLTINVFLRMCQPEMRRRRLREKCRNHLFQSRPLKLTCRRT